MTEKISNNNKKKSQLTRVIDVIKQLRDPEKGCPWDLKQTHTSLLKNLIEESYEFLHAVEENDQEAMKEELGDVLLQVLLHSRIAEQNSSFTLEDVAQTLADKLVFRHPHIFGDMENNLSSDQVLDNWQELKKKEKEQQGKAHINHTIDEQYLNFPALYSAYKIGKKSNDLKFDWTEIKDVMAKVEEELDELKEEIKLNQVEKIKEEMGDLLFSIAQLTRHLGMEPEETLRAANRKFIRRFKKLEEKAIEENKDLKEIGLDEKETLWQKVKKDEKSQKD
jgi:MazG family protein